MDNYGFLNPVISQNKLFIAVKCQLQHLTIIIMCIMMPKFRTARTLCIIYSTEESGSRGKVARSIYARFEAFSRPKRRRWKFESVKTYLCKILGTSSMKRFGASTLRRRWLKNGSKALRGLMKGFEDSRRLAQLSCCHLQTCARLLSERVAELRA